MASEVSFNIRLKVDGKERVVQLSGDVEQLVKELHDTDCAAAQVRSALEEMGNAMGVTRSEAEQLETELVNMNQVAEAISNLTSVISEVQAAVDDLSASYATQEVAEAKLANNMRNTMGARQADVESIKALCAAQQELGVIGDEVQLSGAQELATYLAKKESLEQLIPVMSDMLAQQYGLNASEENAAQIGAMLGKVMEGQTEALSRYGYKFDETQKKVLQLGTEEQRVAVLADVVSSAVGGMNAQLARTDSGKQKQLENTLGDLKETVGGLIQPVRSVVTVLATTGHAVAGVARLCTSIRGLHTMMVTATASSTALKWSIRGLEIATGIGALLAALSIAVELFGHHADKAAQETEELSAETDGLTAALQREEGQLNASRASLELDIARLRDWKGTKAEEKKIVDELNNTYGDTMGYFDSVAKWYEALTKNSEAYCKQLVVEAKMRALANQVAEKEAELDAKRRERKEKVGSGELNTTRPKVAETGVDKFGNTVVTGWKEEASEAEKYINKIDDELIDGALEINRMKNEMRDLAAEAAKVTMPMRGSATRPTGGDGGKGEGQQVTGGVSGLSSMKGLGLGNYTIEVKAVGVDDVTAQFTALGESLQDPLERTRRLIELLAQVEAEGGMTGETMAELNDIMSGMSAYQAATAVASMAAAEERAAKAADKQAKKTRTAKESVSQFGGALAGLGDALEIPALNVAGTIAQAIANIALSYSSAAGQASEMGPWVWLGFAAAGLAEMVAVISSIKQATAFADGGVVSGPTYALIGEYAGASNNPEVVSPLSKLRELIEPAGGIGLPDHIDLVADGRELRATLVREGNHYIRG